ncbi:MAG: hypothetical protein ACJKTH_00695 [Patescibacteria group bacterium UBA2163]
MKNILIPIIAIIVVAGGFYLFANNPSEVSDEENQQVQQTTSENDETAMDSPLSIGSLAGVWQSTEDPNFVRTMYENGGYMDSYEGEEQANGPWVIFTAENAPEEFPYPTEAGMVYLEMQDDSGPLYFAITELTRERLVLIYLNRGGALEFEKVQIEEEE